MDAAKPLALIRVVGPGFVAGIPRAPTTKYLH
jgi:hypothetical protein